MRWLIWALLLTSAYGEEKHYNGVSTYGLLSKSFPLEKVHSILRQSQRPAISILYGTFCNSLKNVSRITRGYDHPVFTQFHISNGACRRYHRCQKGELFRQDNSRRYSLRLEKMAGITKRTILRRVSKISQVISPNVILAISTELENDFSYKAARNINTLIHEHFPFIKIVFNPAVFRGWIPPYTDYVEFHSMFPLTLKYPTICTNDGINLDMPSAHTYVHSTTNCQVRMLWSRELQGLGASGEYILPSRRYFTVPKTLANMFKLFL